MILQNTESDSEKKRRKDSYCQGTSPTSILSPSLSSYVKVNSPLPFNKPMIGCSSPSPPEVSL